MVPAVVLLLRAFAWVVLRVGVRVGCACWLLAPGLAQAERLEAVMRLAAAEDRSLLTHVRGQISDLPVSLTAREVGPLEGAFSERLAAARALAAGSDARIVLWVEREPGTLTVVVVDRTLDRVLVRKLPRGAGPDDASAEHEAGALVVRSALKASQSGEALGTSSALAVQSAAEAERSEPARAPPSEPARDEAGSSGAASAKATSARGTSERVARVWLAVGSIATGDGASEGGSYAIAARAGWLGEVLELGARGSYGLRADVRVPLAELELAQHGASAYVAYAPLRRETVRLSLSLSAGVAVYASRVRSESEQLLASSALRALAVMGVAASLRYLPSWARARRGRAAVALSAGCLVSPQPLELGYARDDEFVRVTALWALQPQGALELGWLF